VGVDGQCDGRIDGIFHAFFNEGSKNHSLNDKRGQVHGVDHAGGTRKDLFERSYLVFEKSLKNDGDDRAF
jgi:hypothetical protein